MRIEIDPHSGFCNGVVRAIRMAEAELHNTQLACLGDIVHNEWEVNRLSRLGMQTIHHADLAGCKTDKILIRAHGEPPSTYSNLKALNRTIIDATCPVVVSLQKRVHQAYLESLKTGGTVIIYGKPGHAEVNGLLGQTDGMAKVVLSPDEIENIDVRKPIYLFSQTTMSIAGLEAIRDAINAKRQAMGIKEDIAFIVNDTICRQVSNRGPQLREFAAQHSIIIFVCGSKSSNGEALYQVSKSANARSYKVSSPEEINSDWFSDNDNVGICGATSTPAALMEAVAAAIKESQHG